MSQVSPHTGPSATMPAQRAVAVTPHDTDTFSPTRGLYIGGSGDAAVVMSDGAEVTFVELSAGTVLPVQCIGVKDTGTTATDIVALY